MSDIITLDKEAKKKILAGIAILAKCLKLTLSPHCHYVLIRKSDGTVISSNKGDVIAEILHLNDPLEQIGIDLLREGSAGKPFTIMLAEAIIRIGMNLVFDGNDSMEIKKDLEASLPLFLEAIDQMGVPVQTDNSSIISEESSKNLYINFFPELAFHASDVVSKAFKELRPFLPLSLTQVREALNNAIATAGALLTVETMITKK